MLRARTEAAHGPVAFPAIDDQEIASRSAARLLITASTQRAVETLARRVHAGGHRAEFPFVHHSARDLPIDAEALTECCAGFIDAAAGGSILISAVEEMPPLVQDVWLELLERLECARHPSAAVRMISGTTVSLLDRVTAAAFSQELFYRLNVIHLVQEDVRTTQDVDRAAMTAHS